MPRTIRRSFASIGCRLDALAGAVAATGDVPAGVRQRIGRQMARARLRLGASRAACAAAKAAPARRQLRKVAGRLRKVVRALSTRTAGVRAADAMRSTTALLLDDTRGLAADLTCP
jgi:hypothetical protein